jgi:hypothetical protein
MLAILVVLPTVAALLLHSGAAGAIPASAPAEVGPDVISSDPALSPAAGPTSQPAATRSVSAPEPAAVDPATYAREKASAAHGPAPQAAAVGIPPADLDSAAQAPVTTSFQGLTRPSSVSNGFVFNPPDTIAGKSSTHVIEATNSAIRLFNTSGTVLSTMTLSAFLGKTVSDAPDDIGSAPTRGSMSSGWR